MTNQKKTTKSKVYDQTALHVDTFQEDGEYDQHETAYKAPDDLTEEEYLEQLASEGDSDAVLIADFELAAQDTIQEDSELAVTLTAYQQARHRLAERFRNRGFFPSRPFTGQGTGRVLDPKLGEKGRISLHGTIVPRRRCKNVSCHRHAVSVIRRDIGKQSVRLGDRMQQPHHQLVVPLHPPPQ